MTDEESDKVAAHFDHLNRLLNSGHILLAGRTMGDRPYAVVMFRAKSYAEAQAFVDDDPAVKGGIFIADLQPFRIALMHQFLASQREMEASMDRSRAGI
ncbi:MAG: YciI family protein [Fimbriimonadaceae bacterium]